MDFGTAEFSAKYPGLSEYSGPMTKPEREIIGRETELKKLMAAMLRPELSNVLLLADPGTGKTALVQAAMLRDTDRVYLEVDLVRMIADVVNVDEMAAKLKGIFDEASRYSQAEEREIVLFLDEFHQIVQLSAAAVEALKPILAASGTLGIRVIAATTNAEFHTHVAPNQPLVERLQRIDVPEPDHTTTVAILRGMAERYGVADQFYDDSIFELIYEYTNRYNPTGSQPRKSIIQLDGMVGWHRLEGRSMDRFLLADVLQDSTGINVIHSLIPEDIQHELDARVFSQKFATRAISDRMQIIVSDLHDKTRPISSFLFAGSTGVGKTELTKQLTKLIFGDSQKHFVRFDMSEYSDASSMHQFRSLLTKAVWNMGHTVVLLDEIEKANTSVVKLLLQVLDDGRLSDDNGRQVSFLNSYIVLTTNKGSEIFKTMGHYMKDDEGSGEQLDDIIKNIRRSIVSADFPPELLGRIDTLVPFQPLTLNTRRKVVQSKLQRLVQEIRWKHGVAVGVHGDVLVYLIEEQLDEDTNAGGAREAIAKMNETVVTEIARFINNYPTEKNIRVDVVGDMAARDKSIRKGNAKIVVSAMR